MVFALAAADEAKAKAIAREVLMTQRNSAALSNAIRLIGFSSPVIVGYP